jgi:UDP-N-acetylglucosamine diphosphorylase / glucose-1-phosphate thymidylyltransferase / UDP-N-acetylgalactosamine diphosphorylase / glucosamine-1-phosphate N-acetyltransferase / galactosamine-1-phosphate N-acetyltransferase
MINIVIPMAGLGSRFTEAGYTKSKPFIDVNGKPMIVRVMENLNYPNCNFILIARRELIKAEEVLVNKIKRDYNCTIIEIDKLTEGTACTVLYARKFINNSIPLLIANSDQIIDESIEKFINDSNSRNLDGSILCFEDSELNPKWSFAKIDENLLVTEVKEKQVISKYATVGIYYFSKGSLFVNSAVDMIIENDRVNNEFYTCPVYNYAIKEGAKVGIYSIKENQMHGIGTPNDLKNYLQFS